MKEHQPPTAEVEKDLNAASDSASENGAVHEDAIGSEVRAALLELLKYGLLENSSKPNLYRAALLRQSEVNQVLNWLDLSLRIDDIRGLAFVVVAQAPRANEDEWSHPLVRRQRLTLEQSLLVAILRQQFVAHEVEAGVGASDARVALDDLIPHLQVYLGDTGSDAQERKRLIGLLEQLKVHGIVSDVDQQERVVIRPIIAHLANPENLVNLLRGLREMADGDGSSASQLKEMDA
ncbi:hypothetical protein FHR53_002817 [Xanthomonas arboricola]